jgi:lipoprotein-anchoring transpeptidase ErfK/SrfK
VSIKAGQTPGAHRVRRVAVALLVSALSQALAAPVTTPAQAVSSKRRASKLRAVGLRTHRIQAPLSRATIGEAEQRLSDLGYWTGPIDGVLDAASRQALIAFQKVEGRLRTGRLTLRELEALRSASRPVPLEAGKAHVEVDLMRQVLFVVDDDGRVSKILSVSSGNNKEFETSEGTLRAVTPPGRFRISRKIPGWRKSELGLMYYPSYIVGGIAIHGSKSVPAYPASHGCIRIPMFAAKEFSDITPIDTLVIVHYNSPQE